MAANGTITTLHSFDLTDGSSPVCTLVQSAFDGNFYGTTLGGGADDEGTVFTVTPTGTITTLHSFSITDGSGPFAGLTQGSDGNFYGSTYTGGAYHEGTIFRISPRGKFRLLHQFDFSDGGNPYGSLVSGLDGNMYGTTQTGGHGSGTVFKITSNGTLSTLYEFCSENNCIDGSAPTAGLIQGTDGNLYGTTLVGGIHGFGTLFQMSLQGKVTTLRSFDQSDGASPYASLIQATNGAFFGTTQLGGTSNDGTIFTGTLGLSSFVAFVRGAAKANQQFGVLGQGFTGTTAVSLNGTPATFTVISDTFIKATVPAGATTGYVTVTTPSGTLTSNVPFHVIQ